MTQSLIWCIIEWMTHPHAPRLERRMANTTRTLLLLLLLSSVAFGSASTVYVTPTGSPTGGCLVGSSIAPNLTPAQFNNSSNWGAGTSQIGAGTTVLLCGTFTSFTPGDVLLSFKGSGASGSPITLVFDSGASITNSTYWGSNVNGAIQAFNQSNIVIDGAGTGLIQNTGNGTGLAYHHNSTGVYIQGGSNVTVKNLSIANICQHTSSTDSAGCTTAGSDDSGIYFNGVANARITGNTIRDAMAGIRYTYKGTANTLIASNTIYRCNWGVGVGANSGVTSAVTISGNNISQWANWDDTVSNTFHHNGLMIYTTIAGTGITGFTISNNYIHGVMSQCKPNSCATSAIFMDDNSAGISGTTIFNNLIVNESSTYGPGNAWIIAGAGAAVYNNTIDGNGIGWGLAIGVNSTAQNNILTRLQQFLSARSPATLSNNIYMAAYSTGCDHWLFGGGPCTGQNTYAAWALASAETASGYYTANTMNSNATLQTGSPAIGAGANLTDIGIPALNSDNAGVARPATGAWDAGAYQHNGLFPPAPPTSLITVIR